ncbi:PAS/PAC sensor protein [Natronococcus amylolyticus DSM 10524]|uniref:PAS/PAC sensor protein n=2 Tax=Natronococcus amylolyticus TaxID=44470 RepID=L9X1H4_9EURY|nr:PAS/PAC sensor protein [Natronococcus amylolyticus DSM 10524]
MFDHLGPPGTPFTTPEIAAEFDCSDRTVYNRLDALVEAGAIETKKVGANSRVWWKPVRDDRRVTENGGSTTNPRSQHAEQSSLFHSRGEMAERIREFDWGETPVGPIVDWPPQLRVAVDIMLGANEAIGIYWGDDLRLLYNDAAVERIGEKHPDALGQPARDVFPEAWDEFGSFHEQVMAGEGPVQREAQYLPIERDGTIEDVWWDSTFNPIPGEDGSVGGVFNISFDVTERLQAERKLRKREQETRQRYRQLFESITEGFCIVDVIFDGDDPVDYRIVEANETFTGLTDAEGRTINEMGAALEGYWYERYGEVARTGESMRFEEHVDAWGKWFDVFAFPVGDGDSNEVGILFDDITERKRQETALRESESKLAAELEATRRLGEFSTELIGEDDVAALSERVLDSALELVDADFASVQLYDPDRNDLELVANRGFSEEAESAWNRVTPEHGTTCGEAFRTGERVILSDVETDNDIAEAEELENYRQTGIRSMQTTPLVSRSGEVLGMFSTHWETPTEPSERELAHLDILARQAADLIERQQTVDALRESQERLDSFVTATSEVVYRQSPDWSELYHLDGKGFIVDTDEPRERWLEEYTPPEEKERVMAAVEEAIETESQFDLEHQVRRVDGSRGWIHSRAVPVRSDDGEITEWFGTATDITKRKEAERKLQQQAELDAFRIDLADAIRSLTDPVAVQQEAARVLGEQLNVARANYCEVLSEDGRVIVHSEYLHGDTPAALGEHHLDDFGQHLLESLQAGESVVVDDLRTDSQFTEEQRTSYLKYDIRSLLIAPILKGGQCTAYVVVNGSTPREWTDAEIEMVEETADRTWNAVQRAQAEQALRESEEKHRMLFESIDEGFMTMNVIFDEDDEAVDFQFLETNSAFEEITGYVDVEGERMRDLEPDYDEHDEQRFEKYGRIAQTGEPERFTDQARYLDGRWFDVFAFRIGEPEERTVAVLFSDITEQKQREERQDFLLQFSDALRAQPDAESIKDQAVEMIAEQLDLDRCYISKVSEEEGVARVGPEQIRSDLQPMSGIFQLSNYPEVMRQLATQTIQIANVADDPRFSDSENELLAGLNIVALLSVPLREGERDVIWALTGTTATPRQWTDSERILLEDAAERTWQAVERARTEEKIRESEKKFRTLAETAPALIWQNDEHGENQFVNQEFLDFTGMSEEAIRGEGWHTLVHPDERDAYVADYQAAVAEQRAWSNQNRLRRHDGEWRWFDNHAQPLFGTDGGYQGHVGVTMEITEHKQAEERQAYLLELNDALRPLTDPAAIQEEACRVLGEHLDVKRAQYGKLDLDRELIDITRDYYRGGQDVNELPSLVGEFDFDDFPAHAEAWLDRRSLAVNDAERDPALSESERAGMHQREVRATLSTPLVKNNEPMVVMAVTSSVPRKWTEEDIALLEETADRTWNAVQRAQAEQALRESEEKYRTLFESIDEGFCVVEIVRDENDRPVDMRYLEHNDAFERQTGLDDAVGKTHADLGLETDRNWFEKYGEVARTGVATRFERYHEPTQRWYNVFVSQIDTHHDRVALVFDDVTERKQRERRDQFMLDLNDEIRTLTDEEAVGEVCTELLAEEMGLDRAYLVRFDSEAEEALVGPEYHSDGLEPVSGLYPFSSFPDAVQQIQTETPVYDDVANDSSLHEAERQALLELDFGAWIGAPIRGENVDLALYAVYSDPHDWTEFELSLVEETADRTWTAVERARAEQALKTSNESLERLNDVGRKLIDADPEAIIDRMAELTVDVLDVEYAALWQYDEQTGTLDVVSEHAESETDLDGIGPSEVSHERVWETFIGDEIDVDVAIDIADDGSWPSRLGSRAFVPLGRHGVVFVGSGHAEAFDEWRLDLLEMVASTVETAWDRAESERALEQRNEELTRLDRLNILIRRTDQGLVDAETVERIDEMVCGRLADSALYEFAWLGEYDADADDVLPRAWAGVDSVSVEDLTVAPNGSPSQTSPFAAAVRSGEMQVVADIATDARAAPWREAALGLGARSCLAIPLAYDDSVYGVVVVYGGQPQPDERDLDVLSELGRTVGHAIHAVETRRTSRTESVVELTLQTTTADTPLVRLAQALDCVLEFEGLVPGADGETTIFFTAQDVDPDEVAAAAERSLAFEELIPLVERDEGHRFKAQVTDESLAAGFLEAGASIRSLTMDAGTATAVVAAPGSTDVRGFIEEFKQDLPDLDLLARRSRQPSPDIAQQLQTAFEDRLTPRQRETLQLAYRSGYFESPRVQTGQDLSEALDLSQSTFNHHLRAAERRVFEAVFDSV